MFAFLQTAMWGLSDKVFWPTISGLVPAIVVYVAGKKDISKAKEFATTAREEARKELAESLAPALNGFKLELLKDMNGTYLRTKEALVHFNAIQHSLERLEKANDARIH
jgi:hypothetical protein